MLRSSRILSTSAVGRCGELIVDEYVGTLGFEVERRNFRIGRNEVDRIYARRLAFPRRQLVVSEIKTRTCRNSESVAALAHTLSTVSLMRKAQRHFLRTFCDSATASPGVEVYFRLFIVVLGDVEGMSEWPLRDSGVYAARIKQDVCIWSLDPWK